MKEFLSKLGRRKNATSSRANANGYRIVSTADVDSHGGSSRVLRNDDEVDEMFIRGDSSGQPVLERNLTLPTLVFLSVSNTIGTGIYVLTGIASNQYAGLF